jgi:hypothetical protein
LDIEGGSGGGGYDSVVGGGPMDGVGIVEPWVAEGWWVG